MANIRRSARGEPIDMDVLKLANESTIAVGNTKTNARGDQLGKGGKVVKTRAQIMKDYHKLDSGQVLDLPISETASKVVKQEDLANKINIPALVKEVNSVPQDLPIIESEKYVKPRGSFADAVAKQTEVTQTLIDPSILNNNDSGLKRI